MATWVLLHGTPLTPGTWRDTAALLVDQEVVTPDLTSVPAGHLPQESLAREVLAGMGADCLDVVGHSFGGQVAVELALAAPAKVRSLTVLCSRDTPFPAFAPAAEQIRGGTSPSVDATLARWFTADELDQCGPAVAKARADLEAASAGDWAAAVAAIARYDRHDRRSEVIVPTTLIAAGHDGVSTPEVMEEFAGGLHRRNYQCVADWSHMSPFVDPARLAKMLTVGRDAAVRSS